VLDAENLKKGRGSGRDGAVVLDQGNSMSLAGFVKELSEALFGRGIGLVS